jgi:hypothetical protein
MTQAIKLELEKDTYEFQEARIERLAAELGKKVEFDRVTVRMRTIKFRAADADKPFTASPTSGDLELSLLAGQSDSWLKGLILRLASQ